MSFFDKQVLENFIVLYKNYDSLNQNRFQTLSTKKYKILKNQIQSLNIEFSQIIDYLNIHNLKNKTEFRKILNKIINESDSLQNDNIRKAYDKQNLLMQELQQKKINNGINIQTLYDSFLQKDLHIKQKISKQIDKITIDFQNKNKLIEKKIKYLNNQQDQIESNKHKKNKVFDAIFCNKNLYLNTKINNINKKLQEKIKIITNQGINHKKLLNKEEEKVVEYYNNELENINHDYQKTIFFHNKSFDALQCRYMIKKKDCQYKLRNIFSNNQLFSFLNLIFIVKSKNNPESYSNFSKLFNIYKQNEFLYLKNLTYWRQNYAFIKASHHKNIQICNMKHNDKINQIKFEQKQHQNIFIQKNKKETLLSLIQIAFIQLQIKLFSNVRKEKQNLSDIQEYANQENINYKKNQLDIEKRKNLIRFEHQKKIISLDKVYQTRENLVIFQLKLEKNKFQLKYMEKINENYKQIIIFERQIENYKNDFCFDKKISSMVYNQEEKNFFGKYQIQQKKNIHFIDTVFLEYKNFLHTIIDFILFNFTSDNNSLKLSKSIFIFIKEKLGQIKKDYYNKNIIELMNLQVINYLCQFFINDIYDCHCFKNYLFYQKKYFLENTKIDNKIRLLQQVIKCYEDNLYFLQHILQNKQNIFINYKYYSHASLENKIKKYEKKNLNFKKQLKKLNQNKLVLEKKYLKYIALLQKKQNYIVQKNNNLQIKLFNYFNKQNSIRRNKNLFIVLKNKLLKLNILSILNAIEYNVDFIYRYIILNQEKILSEVQKLKKEIKNIDYIKKKLIEKTQKQINLFYNDILSIIKYIYYMNDIYKNKQYVKKEILLKQQKYEIHSLIRSRLKDITRTENLIDENLKEAIYNINKQKQEEKVMINFDLRSQLDRLNLELKTKNLYFSNIQQLNTNNQYYIKKDYKEIKKNLLKAFKKSQLNNEKLIKKIDCLIKEYKIFLHKYKKKIIFLGKINSFFLSIVFCFRKFFKKREINQNKFKLQKEIQKKIYIEKQIYLLNLN